MELLGGNERGNLKYLDKVLSLRNIVCHKCHMICTGLESVVARDCLNNVLTYITYRIFVKKIYLNDFAVPLLSETKYV